MTGRKMKDVKELANDCPRECAGNFNANRLNSESEITYKVNIIQCHGYLLD